MGQAKITVAGVELTVSQDGRSVTIKRVVGRDRVRGLDITSGITFVPEPSTAIDLVNHLVRVADLPTARCTCDYRHGYSGHDRHCHSIYVAVYEGGDSDD